MELASSLPIQEIRPCGLRLAPMPPGIGSGGPLRSRQTDCGTTRLAPGPPPSDFSAQQHRQSMDDWERVARYQALLGGTSQV
jgi:hypothetical protein